MKQSIINLLKRILRSKKLTFPLILTIGLYFISNNSNILSNFANDFIPKNFLKSLEAQKELTGKVNRVMDGDTLELLVSQNKTYQKVKIRLFGIDAPEKKQEFGIEAKNYLSSLVLGKEVKIVIESKDKYSRLVGTIYLKDKDINKEMVKNGYAWAYRQYSPQYIAEEADAKMFQLGLWKNPQAINPSEFRRRNG